MPKTSKSTVKSRREHGPVTDCEEELGSYTVNFVEFHEDVDGTMLLKGAPDDRCQCPHWGYVVKGKMTFRFPDRDEVYEAGDAYYAPAGHLPVKHEPGTQIVQFSPSHELRQTQAVMMKNMQSMMQKR